MAETASDLRERHLLSPLSYAHEADLTNFPKHESVTQAKENELHDGLKFGHYMLAGSVAGMVEHMAMFPVDTLKTRMQMLASAGGSRHSTVSRALVSIVKSEGAVGLYRGIGAMGLGAGPAHAVYFSVYEVCKHKLGGNEKGYHPLAHGTAGALATVASDAVFTPMDVVKQRLQLKHTPYRGLTHCIATMLRVEGFGAFYTSYPTTVVMNVPFTAVHFASYEAAKKVDFHSILTLQVFSYTFLRRDCVSV
jgi:solute carrier family 25 iron transporter 28/37